MVMVQIATVLQSRPGVARILNDNYCNKDTQIQVDLIVLGQNRSCQVKVPRTVYLKEKTKSPTPCLMEIKHVQSVSFVSACPSVPPILSIPQCCRKCTCEV